MKRLFFIIAGTGLFVLGLTVFAVWSIVNKEAVPSSQIGNNQSEAAKSDTNSPNSNPSSNGQSSGATASSTQANANRTITISNNTFSPTTLTVGKGETITWVNKDVAVHAIERVGNTGPHSQQLKTNESYTYAFNTPGTYKYICVIHPEMTGTIIVQ